MQPQPPPKGDPAFTILSPLANAVLGPTFSVYGWGPQTLTDVVAWANTTDKTADLQPHPASSATNWEAIFTGMTTGNYGIYATCNNNSGRTPAAPDTISVSVDASPGITIEPPTGPPQPMGAGAPETNPWDGWQVAGTYDSARINGVVIYLTRRGISFWKGAGGRIEQAATLTPSNGRWTCNLNFMPANAVGRGLHIHYVASRVGGGAVHGSLPSFFAGPPDTTDA